MQRCLKVCRSRNCSSVKISDACPADPFPRDTTFRERQGDDKVREDLQESWKK